MNADFGREARGFTLIEVLVALAIVAFGLIAVFGQMSQSATAAIRLRDKTLASWVALNEIAKLRLSGEYPGVGTTSDEIEMANQRWHFEIRIAETEGDYLRRADVSVATAADPERPVATATGFLGEPPGATPVLAGSGWPLITGDEELPGVAQPPPPEPQVPAPEPVTPPAGEDDQGAAEQ